MSVTNEVTIAGRRATETLTAQEIKAHKRAERARNKAEKALKERLAAKGTVSTRGAKRHGVNHVSQSLVNSVVRGSRGDVTNVLSAAVRNAIAAYREAKANVAECVANGGSVDDIVSLSTVTRKREYEMRHALKRWKMRHGTNSKAEAVHSDRRRIYRIVRAVANSYVAESMETWSESNVQALGTLSTKERMAVEKLFVQVLEAVRFPKAGKEV